MDFEHEQFLQRDAAASHHQPTHTTTTMLATHLHTLSNLLTEGGTPTEIATASAQASLALFHAMSDQDAADPVPTSLFEGLHPTLRCVCLTRFLDFTMGFASKALGHPPEAPETASIPSHESDTKFP